MLPRIYPNWGVWGMPPFILIGGSGGMLPRFILIGGSGGMLPRIYPI